jgi:hypothetical protein
MDRSAAGADLSHKSAFLSRQQGTHLSHNADLGAEDTFSRRQTVDRSRPILRTRFGAIRSKREQRIQLIHGEFTTLCKPRQQ